MAAPKKVDFLNRKEINKRICAVPKHSKQGFEVRHDMPGEEIECTVPTLELAACIVKALRERAYVKLAGKLLADHLAKQRSK